MSNLGYGWEKEVEDDLMALGGQKRSDKLTSRSRRQPGSGNQDYAPGDVVSNLPFLEDFGQLVVECKHHKNGKGDGKSISVKKEWVDKVRDEALTLRGIPVLAVKMKSPVGGARKPLFPGAGNNVMNMKHAVIPWDVFLLMLEYIRDLRAQVDSSPSKGPEIPAPSSFASDKGCRQCRRALDKAVEQVRRQMGG